MKRALTGINATVGSRGDAAAETLFVRVVQLKKVEGDVW
jgi:hypothetical protein